LGPGTQFWSTLTTDNMLLDYLCQLYINLIGIRLNQYDKTTEQRVQKHNRCKLATQAHDLLTPHVAYTWFKLHLKLYRGKIVKIFKLSKSIETII